MATDEGLDTLLDLDGQRIEFKEGYWVKFDVRQVPRSEFIPHGISYSLTLHRPDNLRILGFDNAHAVKPTGNPFKYAGQVIPYDHEHPYLAKPVPYRFDSPSQLVSDFWAAVDDAMKQEIPDGK